MQSLWLDTIKKRAYSSLNQDHKTEVLIIGGGLTGIFTAYELVNAGKKVTLVDARQVLQGVTGHTTSKLTFQHGPIYQKLWAKDEEGAHLYKEINQKAITYVDELTKKLNINCDLHEATATLYTCKESEIEKLEAEYDAAKKLNVLCEYTQETSLPFKVQGALRFFNQREFSVTKYLSGILDWLEQQDCEIFEQTMVTRIDEDKSGLRCLLANGHMIEVNTVIMACHYPCHKPLDFYFTKLIPSFSYCLALDSKGKIDHEMLINLSKPFYSFRLAKYAGQDLLIIAGESHSAIKTADKNKHFDRLYQFADREFTVLKAYQRWSTMVYDTTDYLPFIGRIKPNSNLYLATGYGKWGMTKGISAALILRDLMIEGHSPYEALFRPTRFTSIFSPKFFFNLAEQPYKFLKSQLIKLAKEKPLAVGEQVNVRFKGKRYGIYQDLDAKYIVELTCPHLKCGLHFNNAEKTYDCPCHGSRFNYKGEYLTGPSKRNLQQIIVKEDTD